jgi:hypothetical protein
VRPEAALDRQPQRRVRGEVLLDRLTTGSARREDVLVDPRVVAREASIRSCGIVIDCSPTRPPGLEQPVERGEVRRPVASPTASIISTLTTAS